MCISGIREHVMNTFTWTLATPLFPQCAAHYNISKTVNLNQCNLGKLIEFQSDPMALNVAAEPEKAENLKMPPVRLAKKKLADGLLLWKNGAVGHTKKLTIS